MPSISKKFFVAVVIAGLHAPLIAYVMTVRATLAPGNDLTHLPAMALASLLTLTLMPYAVLKMLRIDWNPSRAQLNEPDAP